MPRDGFKLDVPHREDCFVSRKHRAFVLHTGRVMRRRNGRRNGSTYWHCFRCNDPACPAIMLVRGDVLADFIGASDE